MSKKYCFPILCKYHINTLITNNLVCEYFSASSQVKEKVFKEVRIVHY
jgi:hypothetical protein